ncbi:hypothetical protein FB565_005270 [Actinoplanes lutulentus]|uniref:Uncharacterized protein n=1 Tax=Actinoplanes lutulentus TaxID=1287878 RepID=A0A327ZNC2_9ACTN|nr:hypothetical protein [Actinoplanes lutulentus]MBB2945537.1 hypothetical protein [Actinoplanes lutulentus]RAK40331.1 hypothetical protein B0I29_103364 [Actinoplanes lutulentus]
MNLTAQDEIGSYVEEVRQALGGLPATTREELLEDLPEHLAEVLAEGDGTLVERLGSPSAYAAELIASAGLADGSAPRPPGRERFAHLRGRAREAIKRTDVRVGPLLGYARASEFLVLLRPAWWVLRGYLAAMAFAYVFDDNHGPIGLLPRVGGVGIDLFAMTFLVVAILGSIWLGRRGEPAGRVPRLLLRGSSAALAIFAVVGFYEMDYSTRQTAFVGDYVSNQYSSVQDVFVYDGQGNLVSNAQLYDQWGNPIRFGEPGCIDPMTGNWSASRSLGYPFCPDQAPFPGETPDGSESTPPLEQKPDPAATAENRTKTDTGPTVEPADAPSVANASPSGE